MRKEKTLPLFWKALKCALWGSVLLSTLSGCGLFSDDSELPPEAAAMLNGANKAASPPCPRADSIKDYGLLKKYPELCLFSVCTDAEAPGYDSKKIEDIKTFLQTYRQNVPEKFRNWDFIWQSSQSCQYAQDSFCQHPLGNNCSDEAKCPKKSHCEFFLCESEMNLENEKYREFDQFIKANGGGKISARKEGCGTYSVVPKMKPVAVQTPDPTPVPTATPVPTEEVKVEEKSVKFEEQIQEEKRQESQTKTADTSPAPAQESVLQKMKVCAPPKILHDFTTNITDDSHSPGHLQEDNCGCQFKLCRDPHFREYSEVLDEEVHKYESRCRAKFPMDSISVLSAQQCLHQQIDIEKIVNTGPPTVIDVIVDNSAELSPIQGMKTALLRDLDDLLAMGAKLRIYALSQVNENFDGAPQLLAPICEKKRFSAPRPVAEIELSLQSSKEQVSNLVAEGLQKVPAVKNFAYPAGLCFINRLLAQSLEETTSALIPQQHLVFLATHRDDNSNNINAINDTYCFDSVSPQKTSLDQSPREIASQKSYQYYAKARAVEFTLSITSQKKPKVFLESLDDSSQGFYDSLTNKERECHSLELTWLRQKEKITDSDIVSCQIKRGFERLKVAETQVAEPNLCQFSCDNRTSFFLEGQGHDCLKTLAKSRYSALNDYRYVTCEKEELSQEGLRATSLCAENPLVGSYELLPTSGELLSSHASLRERWKFLLFSTQKRDCTTAGTEFSHDYQKEMQTWKSQHGAEVQMVDLCQKDSLKELSSGISSLLRRSDSSINYPLLLPSGMEVEKVTLLAEERSLDVPKENYLILDTPKGKVLQFTPIGMRQTLSGHQKIVVSFRIPAGSKK